MIRALIVDDEPLARQELAELLAETGHVELVAACGNALEAIQALRRERPQALFLDVQMPGVDGFELLGMAEDGLLPAVVMVTAHDQYALKAFDASAVDYLLKPVERERLRRALERVQRAVAAGAQAPPPAQALAPPRIARIPCLAGRVIKLVPAGEVEFVRSGEAGIFVVTAAGEYFTELTLGVLEARAGLLRCHKQFLVNADRVDEISLSDNSLAVITTRSRKTVPVSRRHLADVRAALGL